MNTGIAPPPLEGALLAAPPGFRITALDCDGSTVFAAGFAQSSKVPEVWVGELEPARQRLSWATKSTVRTEIEPDYLVLSADRGARGARFAVSEYDEFSVCGGVHVFERALDPWTEQSRMTHPEGENDILFGVPLLLRGSDLFVFEMPESPTRSAAVHRYRRLEGAWSRSTVPFAPEASDLEWQLAMSPSGDVLAITTRHRDGRHHLDLYSRGAIGDVT